MKCEKDSCHYIIQADNKNKQLNMIKIERHLQL